MPELPEVETVVRSLARSLAGRVIAGACVLHRPSISGSPEEPGWLSGRRVLRVFRRGKFIRMDLEGEAGMAVHLRMTGWLGVVAQASGLRRKPGAAATGAASRQDAGATETGRHERVRFDLDGGRECLVFRDIRTFGRVWCGTGRELGALPALARLGPEPLEIAASAFAARIRERRGRVKPLLLDQKFLAGVGNIYADEALHLAGLHPLAAAARLKAGRAAELLEAIQRVLVSAIAAGGSSIENFEDPEGRRGWFQRELRVYGREGQACLRCGAAIRRIVVGQRGTWFCPHCQKRK